MPSCLIVLTITGLIPIILPGLRTLLILKVKRVELGMITAVALSNYRTPVAASDVQV